MSPDQYASASARELVQALRDRKVGAAELVETAIARIEDQDQLINAVVVRDFERARADAKAADKTIGSGADEPLLGLPMTVKESFDLEGFPTTWGVEGTDNYIAPADSAVVERLRAAGAIILGKTNVPPLLVDWQANNPIYGRTNNPHDLTRSPGGSSGGAAAALAAGMVPLEVGSDIGGSIRFPAAFCGVYGHKSSHRIIPLRGHSMAGLRPAHPDLGVAGPLARTAADLSLALDVLAGPDGDDAKAYRLELPRPRHKKLSDYRVLVMDSHPRCETSSAIKVALGELAGKLARAGAKVARESDLLPDLHVQHSSYLRMLLSITTRRSQSGRKPISAHDWLDVVDFQEANRRQWAELFERFDAVIAPAFGAPAFPHTDEPEWSKRAIMIDGEPTSYGDQLAWASIATFPNLPSTAFPLGHEDSLPIGGQIIGPFLEDHTTIALAGMIADL